MTIKFYAYNMGSQSVKLLCDKMDVYQIKHQGSRYLPRIKDVLINWGSHAIPPQLRDMHIINDPEFTRVVSDKGLYARRTGGANPTFRSIEFTTSLDEAVSWHNDGHTVVARTILNGHEGNGIKIVKPDDPMVNAPLYSKYQSKEREYRVHVVDGVAIKVQRKLRPRDLGPIADDGFMVRNTANGFRFCTVVDCPEDVKTQAINACRHFKLDFGGVDVIYKEARRLADAKAYVVEINSAPGIEGTTVDAYATALTQLANKVSNQ